MGTAAPKVLPLQKSYRTPLVGDVFVRENIDITVPANIEPPVFGFPHDSMDAVKYSFPNHKFCWREGPDRDGNYTNVFIADLPTQHLYNWEISNEGDWPTITQTFVVPRATYKANPADPATLYPPPPADVVNQTGYALTGVREVRTNDEKVDSLYVVVQTTREKIDVPVTWNVFDADTGEIREFKRQKVPAGTPGSVINDDGTYSETSAINPFWSILNTEQAAGLAGGAIDGVSSRTWRFSIDYFWPAVLDYVSIQPAGSAFSDNSGYIVSPKFKVDDYNGPCEATMVETWYKDIPPEILPTVLLPASMEFEGPTLRVYVKKSLHPAYTFFEGGYSQSWPATSPVYWPASLIASVDVSPQFGGWLQRVITIDRPSLAGMSSGLELTVTASDFDSFDLSWTPEVGTQHPTSVNVATSPMFNTGFLPGYQGRIVAAGTNTLSVEGLAQGPSYYAQVTRNGVKSNIVICGATPSAVLQVSQAGIILSSGANVVAGSAAPGDSVVTTITITNRGVLTLTNLDLDLTGANANQFSLGSLTGSLAPGQSANYTITFTPTTGGTKTAVVSLAHDGVGTNPFVLNLTGTGVAPQLQLEQPINTIRAPGSTIAYGTYTTVPISRSFAIRNVGTSNLNGISASIQGTNAVDFTITVEPGQSLAPSLTTPFTVVFSPSEDDTASNNRAAQLVINSNDGASPYTVNLTGVYMSPTAPGAPDPAFNVAVVGRVRAIAVQSDGSSIIGGDFTEIDGYAISYCAKINADGSVDTAFIPGPDNSVLSIAIQEDGKIVIGGTFSTIDSAPSPWIARLNAGSSLDGTFTPPAFDNEVRCLAIQADGKIIAGGTFNAPGPWVARLNTDGTEDTGFITQVNGAVNGVSIQTDGKVIVVGDFPGNGFTTPPPVTTMAPTTPPPTTLAPTTPPPPTTEPPTTTTTTEPPTTPVPTTPTPTTPVITTPVPPTTNPISTETPPTAPPPTDPPVTDPP